jgi:hypothetical protein
MKPSSFRILAIASFNLDDDTNTASCLAMVALRIRVSISAIGSEIVTLSPLWLISLPA